VKGINDIAYNADRITGSIMPGHNETGKTIKIGSIVGYPMAYWINDDSAIQLPDVII
jgi:hypothetical protein